MIDWGGAMPRLGVVLALLVMASPANAQVPHAAWRTMRTEHFYVHFTRELEEPARRAAASAERAYDQLAAELVPPRGVVDLVIADNADVPNGRATPIPTNRIVVYAQPPVDVLSLRFYDDWLELVITHELAHIFHLDRARGWWRVAQRVFGRAPFLMPNAYAPAWVIEGLATYYESLLTGAGRVAGTHERMLVRADVLDGGLRRPDEWSLATSRHPGGEVAYGYGSLFFDFLARTRGRDRVATFVERSSGAPIPFFLNRIARRSFGTSFNSAWREWRDSLRAMRAATRTSAPLTGWRDLTGPGRLALHPRWQDTTTMVFAANPGKEMPGAYRVDTAGRVRRLGRRNGVDRNVPLPDNALLFAQLDYTSPYHLRSDLYVQRGGRVRRLTRGARLSAPDARADGAILAVRSARASTQLVRVSRNGRRVTPLTPLAPDTQWAEPRWSPRGDRIAASRWTRGGYADIVVLDTTGALLHEVTHDRAVDSSPSWSRDGSAITFASDRTGITELYLVEVDSLPLYGAGPPSPPKRLSRAAVGVFDPALSPDARQLAAVRYAADGWRVGVAPLDTAGADSPPPPPSLITGDIAPPARDSSPARPYSPWGSLLPRYWLPLLGEAASGGLSVGVLTSGVDIVGRHAYAVQGLFDTRGADHEAFFSYRYAGLGQPLLTLEGDQTWERAPIVDSASRPVGDLRRRTRRLSLAATVIRPRMRTNGWAALGAEVEQRIYSSDPEPLLARLDPFYSGRPQYRSVLGSLGWSNVQVPTVAISPEDGITFFASGRLRWLAGEAGVLSRSVRGVLTAYKSIDAWGYAHHVLAARAAGGYASGRLPVEFGVGGTSGSSVALAPHLSTGERHTFAVRGFPAGARVGTRAVAGSLEYRAPLSQPARGFGFWPLFLDRTSVSIFADAGAAWGDPALQQPASDNWLASVGAELNVDLAVQYDFPYRVRLGLAVPVTDDAAAGVRRPTVYLRVGAPF